MGLSEKRRYSRDNFDGKHNALTKEIIGVFYAVHNELGYGFSEKIYENAMVIRLQEIGLSVKQQFPITVYFANRIVGEYLADLIDSDLILLELKAARRIIPDHEAQLLNYLKATEYEVGYVLNFGPKAEFTRKVFDNDRKGSLSWVRPLSTSNPKNP